MTVEQENGRMKMSHESEEGMLVEESAVDRSCGSEHDWTELSPDIIFRILVHFSFHEIAQFREVSHSFNESGKQLLNAEARRILDVTKTYIESLNKKHPLGLPPWQPANMKPKTRKFKIMELIRNHIRELYRVYELNIDDNSSCFVAGKILDLANDMLTSDDVNQRQITEMRKLQARAIDHCVVPLLEEESEEEDPSAAGEPDFMDDSWLHFESEPSHQQPSDQQPGTSRMMEAGTSGVSSKMEAGTSGVLPKGIKITDEISNENAGCFSAADSVALAVLIDKQLVKIEHLNVVVDAQQDILDAQQDQIEKQKAVIDMLVQTLEESGVAYDKVLITQINNYSINDVLQF